VHIAVDSGEGILVQFVEQPVGQEERFGANMANINERDELSEYSDEKFDEEEKVESNVLVPRVTPVQVESELKQIRLLFMIKKVPRTHMVKYLLLAERLAKNEDTGEDQVSTKTLALIFERKFNFSCKKATKIARFFVEGPAEGGSDTIVDKEHFTDRETLIERFRKYVTVFMVYNVLAVESMLSRLQGIMRGKGAEFLDDLNLDDEDSNGFLPFSQI